MTLSLRCIVTGASSGIGAAIAADLRAHGHEVVGVDIDPAPDGSATVLVDLADRGARATAWEEAQARLGGVDVLVNAAGIFREGSVLDSGPPDWDPVWRVNLEAPMDLMRRAAEAMSPRGWGRIVNITSIHARLGHPACLAYDTAKAALEAATRSAAIDLAESGVLVNAVAPGFVRTRMSLLPDGTDESDTEDFRARYVEGGRLPVGRSATAAEIAPVVRFLVSPENTYTTGAVWGVDGGLGARF